MNNAVTVGYIQKMRVPNIDKSSTLIAGRIVESAIKRVARMRPLNTVAAPVKKLYVNIPQPIGAGSCRK